MRRNILMAALIVCALGSAVWAQEQRYSFSPDDSRINGSIKYSVVGRYTATFERFRGVIVYDARQKIIRSVSLQIEMASIKSGSPMLDKAVRSKRLMDAQKFPLVTFQSNSIERSGTGFQVNGVLTMHGIARAMEFKFAAADPAVKDGQTVLAASGKWVIPRKDFGIVWNRVLDKGGVLVGNHVTVEWQVSARPTAFLK